jgi:diphosphomevalonate decarboxylase
VPARSPGCAVPVSDSQLTRSAVIERILATAPGGRGSSPQASGRGAAPSNIALVKYWGKRDERLNLPVTGSLSVSLGCHGTITTIQADAGDTDSACLNGRPLSTDSPFARRLWQFLDAFRVDACRYHVDTQNTVATAAGMASSASGYAALVLALDALWGWQLPTAQLSVLARLGSGSAARSVHRGFVEWHAGTQADGMDSFATPLAAAWPALRIGLLTVSEAEKAVSSRAGMRRSVATSPFYRTWPAQVAHDLEAVHSAISVRDFQQLGTIAEANALVMHSMMMTSAPPLLYWQAETVAAMQQVWQLRQNGTAVFFSIDAGPNLALFFEAADETKVRAAFPELTVTAPFADRMPA